MEFRKILLPTDFTEGSAVAAGYALDLARRFGSKICLLHVIYDIEKSAGWYVAQIDTAAIYTEMQESARREMDREADEFFPDLPDVEKVILRGVPHEEIVNYARENGVDLIVLGTHGRKGIDRMIFGSSAVKVIRTAECPVLTVRERHNPKGKNRFIRE